MKRLTVRLVLSYILAALLILGAAGLIAGRVLDRYLLQLDQATGQSRLDEAARVTGVILAKFPEANRDEIQMMLSEVFVGVSVAQLRPAEASAMPIQPGPPPGRIRSVSGPEVIKVAYASSDSRTRVITVEQNLHVLSAYRVTLESPTTVRTSTLRWALIGAGALGLLVSASLAVWFSRTTIVPLNRLVVAAGRLAEGEWDTPLLSGGPVEIKRLGDAFRTMAGKLGGEFQRLRADRRSLQQLVAEMAHELKTPIASLRTYHELLLDGEAENPAIRHELLERGASQVHRLEYLTQSLLEMARLEADGNALDLVEADLTQLVRHSVGVIAPVADRQRIRLEVCAPAVPIMALADPQRIGQALDNLLQNALRVSAQGGVIRVAVEAAGGTATITVSDSGPGIPEALLPRLFDPFVRGPSSQGAGLGLSIVRSIAEAHGGGVTAETGREGGAELILSLPVLT